MVKKSPNSVDRYVGSRVRLRRSLAGLSQEKLAQALGITFQQVQKYEKGTNRIGASRLHQIASVLGVPVSFFYEGAPMQDPATGIPSDSPDLTYQTDFLSTLEGVQLMKAFLRIKDVRIRRKLVDFVSALGGLESPDPPL